MATNKKSRKEEVFGRRLETYCHSQEDLQEDLDVSCRSVVVLSASPKHASAKRPQVLQTTDLAELKRWIGNPDEAVRNRCFADIDARRGLKELAAVVTSHDAEAKPAGTRLDAVRTFARSYIYGDSTLAAQAKSIVEKSFGIFEIYAWLFRKIKVSSGSVLAFGPGANVLNASEIEIEEGGRVVSYGSLTVNVATLRKTTPPVFYAPIDLHLVVHNLFRSV